MANTAVVIGSALRRLTRLAAADVGSSWIARRDRVTNEWFSVQP